MPEQPILEKALELFTQLPEAEQLAVLSYMGRLLEKTLEEETESK
jgi:hypothetical protein